MSAIVDYAYYTGEYMGTEADEASFPALNAHASRIIGAMTRWQVDEDTIDRLPSLIRTMYRLAVCSQIDFLALNGVESISGGSDNGFTVGKVSVSGSSESGDGFGSKKFYSPRAISFLERAGLLGRNVGVVC